MLKITILTQTQRETALRVEGRVIGTAVGLLERELARWSPTSEHLLLDLHGVHTIDRAGLDLLQRWSAQGLTWRNAGPYVQLLLEQCGLAQGSDDPLERRS